MGKLKIKNILLEIQLFIKAKWLHFIVFFAINVVIGSLGVWLAVVIAASNDQKTAFTENTKSAGKKKKVKTKKNTNCNL